MKSKTKTPPYYDPDAEPIMDINRIKQLLPHTYPMLLVDKIIELNEKEIVGLKNVTFNEAVFTGHFPTEPVMPGVYIVEAMAQCGGLLALKDVKDGERFSTYFLAIKEAKFKKKVKPGDTLLIRVEYITPVSHGIATMHAVCFVGTKVVAEATFTARIVKNI